MTRFREEVAGLQAEFLDWVLRQDPEREINHASWGGCAVGDFVRTVGEYTAAPHDADGDYWTRPARDVLPLSLYRLLNFSFLAHGQFPTYGALATYIRTHYVEGTERSTTSGPGRETNR